MSISEAEPTTAEPGEPGEEQVPPERLAVVAAIEHLRKRFGAGVVTTLGSAATADVAAISTGALPLDIALGIGGIPRGRLTEIHGPEAAGKTTLVYALIAQAQRAGGTCAVIDVEHALDPAFARVNGVCTDALIVAQPDDGEQALEIAEALVRSGGIDVLAIDSVAALVPRAELEGEMGDLQVGLQARLVAKAARKLTRIIAQTGTALVVTNQLRERIGYGYGPSETTPGGRALKHAASVRIDVRRGEAVKEGELQVGHRMRCRVVKSKVAAPFRQAEVTLTYSEGIDWVGSVLDAALERKLVSRSGAHLSFGAERLGQGRSRALSYLREHPDVAETILAAVVETLPEGQRATARPDQPATA